MVNFIQSHENPFEISSDDNKLHNILTQEVMSDEIRDDLLYVRNKGSNSYRQFRQERFIAHSVRISDTIHRCNIKTFKSISTDTKSSAATGKHTQRNKYAQAQKTIDLARVRGYDLAELFKYDLVSTSYLFEEDGCMTKPQKGTLTKELEKSLSSEDYVSPGHWERMSTSFVVDVMGYCRRVNVKSLKTFGNFCDTLLDMIVNVAHNADRIDFVFDTYTTGSVKDSERLRRSKTKPINLSSINPSTPLPVVMDTFWASNSNKEKLQRLIREHVRENGQRKFLGVWIFLSGTAEQQDPHHCRSVGIEVKDHPELDSKIEEADHRFIPHALHAGRNNTKRLVVLSNDTDVLVAFLYFWDVLNEHGLEEVWMRAGIGDTTRYVPLHILARRSANICKALPAIHTLSGCDTTSKFGTKPGALKAFTGSEIQDFGKNPFDPNLEDTFTRAEKYLVQVLRYGSNCKTLDDLRYWVYHHSKGFTIDKLPPTSRSVRGHIMRAFHATHTIINCLGSDELDPKLFAFEQIDGMLLPSAFQQLVPDDFVQNCNCVKCATQRCLCRRHSLPCCKFCKCQSVERDELQCKNPNVVLHVPMTL